MGPVQTWFFFCFHCKIWTAAMPDLFSSFSKGAMAKKWAKKYFLQYARSDLPGKKYKKLDVDGNENDLICQASSNHRILKFFSLVMISSLEKAILIYSFCFCFFVWTFSKFIHLYIMTGWFLLILLSLYYSVFLAVDYINDSPRNCILMV